jgi:hypothetical protein
MLEMDTNNESLGFAKLVSQFMLAIILQTMRVDQMISWIRINFKY